MKLEKSVIMKITILAAVIVAITLITYHYIAYGQQITSNNYATGYIGAYVIDYYNTTVINLAKHGALANNTLIDVSIPEIKYVIITQNGRAIPIKNPHHPIGTKVIYDPETNRIVKVLKIKTLKRHDPYIQPVALVGMAFPDDSFRPQFNQIMNIVFGGFPSVANYWQYASLQQLILENTYSNAWGVLPHNSTYYCSVNNPLFSIANDTIYYMYETWGVKLQNYTILMIYTNEPPPCYYGSPGLATIGPWTFTTPYGTLYIAVSVVFYYNYTNLGYYDIASPSRFIGYNLGLEPLYVYYGSPYPGYSDWYDLMGGGSNYVYTYTSWGGYAWYLLPVDTNAFYKWLLGFVDGPMLTPNQLTSSYATTLYCSSVNYNTTQSVIIINETNDYIALSLRCYSSLNPYTTTWLTGLEIYYYNATTGQFYMYSLDGAPWPESTGWQALVEDYLIEVTGSQSDQYTNPIYFNITMIESPANISSLGTLLIHGAFVVGDTAQHYPLYGAYTIDVASAIYVAGIYGAVTWYPYPNPSPNVFVDTQIATYQSGSVIINYTLISGWYIAAFGGPLVNYITYAYNPPNTIGYDGLPFFYSSTAGGIEDARTGQVYTGHVFMVAILYNPSIKKYIVLVWGLTGIDTEAAGIWLANYGWSANYRAVIVQWSNTTGLPTPSPYDSYTIVDHWP